MGHLLSYLPHGCYGSVDGSGIESLGITKCVSVASVREGGAPCTELRSGMFRAGSAAGHLETGAVSLAFEGISPW